MRKYYFAIDTETGGLDSRQYELLEIAGILGDDQGNIIKTMNWIIDHSDPFLQYNAHALMINRYLTRKREDDFYRVGDADAVAEDWAKFSINTASEYNNNIRLLGHNLAFDIDFINNFVEKHASIVGWKDLWGRHNCDTKSVAQYLKDCELFDEPIKSTSLEYLIDYFGIDVGSARAIALSDSSLQSLEKMRIKEGHCALDDAEATYQLYLKMMSLIQKKGEE